MHRRKCPRYEDGAGRVERQPGPFAPLLERAGNHRSPAGLNTTRVLLEGSTRGKTSARRFRARSGGATGERAFARGGCSNALPALVRHWRRRFLLLFTAVALVAQATPADAVGKPVVTTGMIENLFDVDCGTFVLHNHVTINFRDINFFDPAGNFSLCDRRGSPRPPTYDTSTAPSSASGSHVLPPSAQAPRPGSLPAGRAVRRPRGHDDGACPAQDLHATAGRPN